MNQLADKISDSELSVMRVLWAAEGPLPLATIRKAVCEKTGWESSTIKTLISRLTAKGAVVQEKRNVYYYTAALSEKEYNEYSTQQFLDKLFAGNAKELVATLVSSKKLSEDDISDLRRMFREENSDE